MADFEEELSKVSPVWSRARQLVVASGHGACLVTETGEEYLDFTTGIGVTNTGHTHPRVVKAIQDQAERLIHGQANIVIHQPMLELIRELSQIVPEGIDSFFFSNSGAEAIEGALKLARAATQRTNVIVFQGSFHGRTVGTMSLTTSKTVYRAGYQPLMPGVFVAPFPYAYRYGWDEEETSQWCLNEFEFLLKTQTAPEETAAVLIEPVLGEGGYVVPPASFMQGLRKICDKYGILLIADEIQSGFGRTGKWFAFEHFGIMPDIIVAAKGLASGMPLSAVMASQALMDKWPPGSHGGTYGGNAVSAAAAVATIQVMKEERLLENTEALGAKLIDELKDIQLKCANIGEVRGLGLMVGVEFRDQQGQPDKQTTKAVVEACFQRKLLLLTCGPWENTIRWIPPLNVSEEQLRKGLAIFEEALVEVYEN